MFPIRDDQPTFTFPFINYFLIGLNIAVFLFELSLTRGQLNALIVQSGVVPHHDLRLLSQGFPVAVLLHILASMFMHGSWAHIIGNMWFLWIFGDNIEDYLGHFRYLIFYLFAGTAATVAHIALNANSNVPSVGASGAIAGVMGAYIVLHPNARVLTWFPPIFLFQVPAWLMLGYWFFAQFISGAVMSIAETSQTTGGVAFWAHVGGFVAGVVMIKLFPQRRNRQRYGTW
jgi:membrane associated rhomboid family serine protease